MASRNICGPIGQGFLATIVLVIFCFTTSEGGTCSNIQFNADKNADKDYLKRVLDALGSHSKQSTADKRFFVGICEKADGASDAKTGVFDKTSNISAGQFDNITVGAPEKGSSAAIYIRYGSSTPCKNVSTWQSVVTVFCDAKTSADELLLAGEFACSYTFVMITSSICDVQRKTAAATAAPTPATPTATAAASSSKSSHMSAFTGFILFLLAVACGYFIIGFLYKRYVLGARGAQQIPNYLFWIRVSHAVQDCVSNRSSRYTTSTSRTAEYDRANAADVQLMNDGEEFKYDQPPLTVGPGAGQTSNFRQQPLNVAPNTPSVNAQRQQQQHEPLLLPQDDADERLLQV